MSPMAGGETDLGPFEATFDLGPGTSEVTISPGE